MIFNNSKIKQLEKRVNDLNGRIIDLESQFNPRLSRLNPPDKEESKELFVAGKISDISYASHTITCHKIGLDILVKKILDHLKLDISVTPEKGTSIELKKVTR